LLSYVRERGQGLVEYALIILLVVLVVIVVVTLLGPIVGNMLSKVNSNMPKRAIPTWYPIKNGRTTSQVFDAVGGWFSFAMI